MGKQVEDERIGMLLDDYIEAYRKAPSIFIGKSVDAAELSLIRKQIRKSAINAIKDLAPLTESTE